jgi:hypothetical protein
LWTLTARWMLDRINGSQIWLFDRGRDGSAQSYWQAV